MTKPVKAAAKGTKIRFVYDREGAIIPIEAADPRAAAGTILDRSALRCCACGQPLTARAGPDRVAHFSHRGKASDNPPCPWRSEENGFDHFSANNPLGLEGRWHTQAAIEISYILSELMCLPIDREPFIRTSFGLRKPDIAFSIARQKVHIELQASPTNLPSIEQRTDRDASDLTSTLWIINAHQYERMMTQSSSVGWIRDLMTFGSNQIWLWDEHCFQYSLSRRGLFLKRAIFDDPDTIQMVRLTERSIPYTVAYCCKIHSGGMPTVVFHRPSESLPSTAFIKANMDHETQVILRNTQASRAERRYAWRYQYGYARLNVPYPASAPSQLNDDNARRWFDAAKESFITLADDSAKRHHTI
ncbi:hypothetical protein J2Y58_002611 [Sphingomonas sp. BE138]|uniref:competence protein CoiA family protein n=1 Tax=Sphingomonas sp. BE138 TaxID=2817845 RepID=UPI00285B6813|nr:competence protein CoiA family protein [Sphingomonas sp. BE138]MDR6789240.1 hypothetical protein [Sphingomonas sp. BE138]